MDKKIIKGKAVPTKEGYYVDGFVLTDEEIVKYDNDLKDYSGKIIEVIGKVREENNDVKESDGIIVQQRQGTVRYIYDITSINVVG